MSRSRRTTVGLASAGVLELASTAVAIDPCNLQLPYRPAVLTLQR